MINQLLTLLTENDQLLIALGAFSLLCFLATLIAVPVVIINLPDTYFSQPERHHLLASKLHPALLLPLLVVKNLGAVLLIAAGLVMLVIPGQGLLTILIGVMLLDFPGKYRLQRALVSRPALLKSINWLRRKYGRKPISLD